MVKVLYRYKAEDGFLKLSGAFEVSKGGGFDLLLLLLLLLYSVVFFWFSKTF